MAARKSYYGFSAMPSSFEQRSNYGFNPSSGSYIYKNNMGQQMLDAPWSKGKGFRHRQGLRNTR